jgi:hypothetical protein
MDSDDTRKRNRPIVSIGTNRFQQQEPIRYTHGPFASFVKLSCETVWPQRSLIGGFEAVVCCFETGQVKTEWKRREVGRGMST